MYIKAFFTNNFQIQFIAKTLKIWIIKYVKTVFISDFSCWRCYDFTDSRGYFGLHESDSHETRHIWLPHGQSKCTPHGEREKGNFLVFSKDHFPHLSCKGVGVLPQPHLYGVNRFLLRSFSMSTYCVQLTRVSTSGDHVFDQELEFRLLEASFPIFFCPAWQNWF